MVDDTAFHLGCQAFDLPKGMSYAEVRARDEDTP